MNQKPYLITKKVSTFGRVRPSRGSHPPPAKPYLITIGIIILILFGPIAYILTRNPSSTAAWYSSNYGYRKPITITYSGSPLTNHDVIITLDTASLISAGKMQADCDDIRLIDSDDTTLLSYWVEAGCDTTTTQIWAQVPSIPDGGKTIYVYYGYPSAVNGEQSWSGNFILMNNTTCPSGWTRNSSFDNRLVYATTSYGGSGGSSSHSHSGKSITSGGGSGGSSADGPGRPASGHTHNLTATGSSATVWPPYLDMVFCQKSDLDINAGLIAVFDTSVPVGWTRFSSLDSKFPRGNSSYGGTSGATTHTHTITYTGVSDYSHLSGAGGTKTSPVCPYSHTHTFSSNTSGSTSSLPPYKNVIFGDIDSTGVASANVITMASAVPPLGWSQFSALNSKYIQGSSSYGGTGGASSHTHSFSQTSGGPSANSTWCQSGSHGSYSSSSHTHSASGTTNSASYTPPYLNTIFIKRDNPAATTAVGSEEQDNVAPNTPTLDWPSDTAINQSVTPILKTTATDDDGDYIRYKIELCENVGMSTNCQTYDQTASQTGWSGQNTESSTAYTSGTQGVYTVQSALTLNFTYYWRSYAIDPGGSNTWSGTQTPYSFTTGDSPAPPSVCVIEEASDDTSLTLNWQDNSDEDGFEIERSDNGGAWADLTTKAADTTSHQDSTISQGNVYQYRVASYYTGPNTSNWCYSSALSIQSASFQFEGVQLEGVQLN